MMSQFKVEFPDGMRVYASVTKGAKTGLLTWVDDAMWHGKPHKWVEAEVFPVAKGWTAEDLLRAEVANHTGSKWGPVVGLPGKR